jgi:ribosomal protein S18 acetylase RimI-like enzyme
VIQVCDFSPAGAGARAHAKPLLGARPQAITTRVQIEQVSSRSDELLEAVRAGMRRYTESQVPWEGYDDLTVVARDDQGQLIGAALGEAGRGWLHLSVVWVDERFRQQRVGRQLVEMIEVEARRRGCHSAYLDTFSYQAPLFYEKLGYVVFGTLDDYPVGHRRFYMCKRLVTA